MLVCEISKGLLEFIVKILFSKEMVIVFRFVDEVVVSVIEWDSRLAIEFVMRFGRMERILLLCFFLFDLKDMMLIIVDILKFYCLNVNVNDRMLFELLWMF